MKKLTLTIILLLVITSGSYSLAGASPTGASFLTLDTDARATGLGGAFAGMHGGISAAHYNPSGIAALHEREFLATHAEWISGMNYEFIGFASPVEISVGNTLKAKGTAGVSLIYLSAGSIERRDVSGEKIDGDYSAYDMALSFSYGQKLNDSMNLGMNFKIIHQSIDGENANGFAIDLGNSWKTSVDGLSFGLALRNLGPGMKFIQASYNLPLSISFEGTYRTYRNYMIGLDISYQPFEGRTGVSLGGEYNINKTFSLRTGYNFNLLRPGSLRNDNGILPATAGLSGGMGLNFPGYRIDYAFVPLGELGITHRVSFSTRF